MRKRLRKYGNSLIISFSEEEKVVYDLEEGTIIDLGDMMVLPNNIKTKKKEVKNGIRKSRRLRKH